MSVISDLRTLLLAQDFANVTAIYGRNADQGAYSASRTNQKAYITLNGNGGDRNSTLSGNDGSLIFTDVIIDVHSPQPTIDAPIGDAIADFLQTSINITMGSRTLFGAICDDPEDFANPPIDGTDNWDGGTRVIAHLEHN
jgi:hypothetical protein